MPHMTAVFPILTNAEPLAVDKHPIILYHIDKILLWTSYLTHSSYASNKEISINTDLPILKIIECFIEFSYQH